LTYPGGATISTTTNSLGGYKFDNLAPGSYSVTFTTPAGMVATLSNTTAAGATDLNDSDPIAGVVSGIAITTGTANISVDAGFHNSCSTTISGNVWYDEDLLIDNMVDSAGQAAANTPLPVGLQVNLVNVVTGKVARTTTVLGTGRFSISNVAPGTYTVILSTETGVIGQNPPNATLPEGWFNTGEHVGITPGADPQTNGRITFTNTYECLLNINFGILLTNEDRPNP
jgi:SdrD B-like domain